MQNENASNYSYVQAIASNMHLLTEEQAEDLFERISETIAQFEEEVNCDCNMSIYIFNEKNEPVY